MSKTTETHDDGSRTERDGNTSTTFNPDNTVREHSRPETSWPVPNAFGPHDLQVTYDGDGNRTNVQRRG